MDSEVGVIDGFVFILHKARRIHHFKNEPNLPSGCGSFLSFFDLEFHLSNWNKPYHIL
jgi:hypothetical protein